MRACGFADPEIDIVSDPHHELPARVARLRHGGLLPFGGLSLLTAVDAQRAPAWAAAQLGGGAFIFGFVGALPWGAAMSARDSIPRNGGARLAEASCPPGWPMQCLEVSHG